jgi:hypothetical protein
VLQPVPSRAAVVQHHHKIRMRVHRPSKRGATLRGQWGQEEHPTARVAHLAWTRREAS